jgi:diguanylate cyclase (GGDEF)-like protein
LPIIADFGTRRVPAGGPAPNLNHGIKFQSRQTLTCQPSMMRITGRRSGLARSFLRLGPLRRSVLSELPYGLRRIMSEMKVPLFHSAESQQLDAEEIHRRLNRLAELERQMKERSAELAWTNERLVAELYDRNALEATASMLERYDTVTGLPNRRALEERLERALVAHGHSQEPAAVVMVGIDEMSRVRESLGYAAGDQIARQIADRLRLAVRGSDVIARIGDNEFALLLAHLRQARHAELVARKLFDLLNAPFRVDGRELRLEPAVGVSVFPQDGESADLLLARADGAMRYAREHGTGLAQFFRPDIAQRTARRLQTEADLRAGLERDEFLVVYQPRIDLANGEMVGAEALVRWRHPERGLLSPGDFLDVAEETGLIVPIGERVLHAACQAAAAWTETAAGGTGKPSVAVNLSPREFRGKSLLGTVEEALGQTGLDPRRLQVELNEAGLARPLDEVDAAALAGLRAIGVRVSLDGFGAGSASLSVLRKFPVDAIKIDGQFVRHAPDDRRDALIVSAVAGLGRRLGLRVVATGIETTEQQLLMRKLGCHEGQGFLFSAPMQAEELAAFRAAPRVARRRRRKAEEKPQSA